MGSVLVRGGRGSRILRSLSDEITESTGKLSEEVSPVVTVSDVALTDW